MVEWRSPSRKRKDRTDKRLRAERARAEAQTQHLRSLADSPVFQRVMVAQHKAAGEILRENSDRQGVLEAALDTVGVSDYLSREHLKVLPPERAPACREGCHHCCYLRVHASVPEIFLLAEWLRARKSADELDALRAKLRAAAVGSRVLSL